jgi:hypothetical protein
MYELIIELVVLIVLLIALLDDDFLTLDIGGSLGLNAILDEDFFNVLLSISIYMCQ